MTRRADRLCVLGLVAALAAPGSVAQVPAVPDAIRPGAVRPADIGPTAPPRPPAPELYRVPPVVDRPLDIDQGDVIVVERFELKGVVERADRGIALAEIQAILDAKRAERPQGFTVGRLQEVAQAVTDYYRGKGLILAQAFVPVQEVSAGVVVIEVLEGRLGRVLTEGNEHYKSELLSKPFDDLIGQPVTQASVEEALLRLTDNPGLSVFGIFQPGQQVGDADMVLKVQQEKPWVARLRHDNHGVRETGERRTRADLEFNNPTGAGDQLTLVSQYSAQGANSFFYSGDYDRPIWNDYAVNLGFDRNQFRVGGEFGDQDIESETENAYVGLYKTFIRSRQRNLAARLDITRKTAITSVRSREQSIDRLAVLMAETSYDSVDTRFAGLNSALLQLSFGFNDLMGSMGENDQRPPVPPSRRGGNGDFASGEFNKVFGSYSRLQSLAPLGEFFANKSILLRTEFQWSNDILVPLEQYAVGGPYNVRGYRPTEALFDKAVFGSLEFIVNAPGFSEAEGPGGKTWGELLQMAIFYDVAYGELNDPLPTDLESETYDSVGVSVQFNNPDVFSTKLSLGYPISGPQPINDRRPQYWLDFNLAY